MARSLVDYRRPWVSGSCSHKSDREEVEMSKGGHLTKLFPTGWGCRQKSGSRTHTIPPQPEAIPLCPGSCYSEAGVLPVSWFMGCVSDGHVINR